MIEGSTPERQWPDDLPEEAYHGLAGDFVRVIEPQTESDPVALLLQFLVFFGNVIGRSAHFVVEETMHCLNLFAVLVGATSKGRKGTALDHVKRLYETVDPVWRNSRIQSGLSSGEGLIWAVRDAMPQDPGIHDKRLLVIESEFAALLSMLVREGNVVSPTIRQAWDSGELRILTKNSPALATGAHISIVGHISAEELRSKLDSSSASNGFGNRFQWACVKRSKSLPEGGSVDRTKLDPLIGRLQQVVVHSRQTGEVRRDAGAGELWRSIYDELSDGNPGLHGSLTARAEAQVMRLACVFALLDESTTITTVHLHAALALWKYEDQSLRFLFGDSLGDPLADRLRRGLRSRGEQGFTRTEIRDLLGRHEKAADITRALNLLAVKGLARRQDRDTGGRPEERWFAIG